MLNAHHAVILNFTANSYHWGCYGTAMEIYHSLQERGYYMSCISVHDTHGFTPSPVTLEQMRDPKFIRDACRANPILATALREADIVVVNGEGTLHHTHNAPRNLLFFMDMARRHFGKPVHLINHSFYPSGSRAADADADALYAGVASGLAHVVPRELYSLEIAQRLGVTATQGFDCLPRFIVRHRAHIVPNDVFRDALILSGAVNMTETSARQIARIVNAQRKAGQKLFYLMGAKSEPAPEDIIIYGWMRAEAPDLELYDATSMREWLCAIAGAKGLVSGRFHHTLAAAMIGTPAIVFPNNMPKSHGACEMMGLESPIPYDDAQMEEKLITRLAALQSGNGPRITDAARQKILTLAEANFAAL